MHTSQLQQYATFVNGWLTIWKRPRKTGQRYVAPVIKGRVHTRSRKAAEEYADKKGLVLV